MKIIIKAILILLGSISLFLGVLGIFVPGLPTTPFLLLSAGMYIRSSEKLYNMVITNKLLGPYIINYQRNKCMTLRLKIYSISLMWIMITLSCVLFIQNTLPMFLVLALGIVGTCVMGFAIKTCRHKPKYTGQSRMSASKK
ncbi:MAG: YbaN family protein [Bacteroidota bacterium]